MAKIQTPVRVGIDHRFSFSSSSHPIIIVHDDLQLLIYRLLLTPICHTLHVYLVFIITV